MTVVLDVLIAEYQANNLPTETDVPPVLLDAFGAACAEAGLLDEQGSFDDPYQLVRFFVQPPARPTKRSKKT
jgi:hypothetical protein